MALTHWYTGIASETTATVVVRASANENVTVSANGEDKVVACATATNDGNAVATFTGLSPGQRYPYTVNGEAGGELRPFPTTYPFWVALSSCWAPKSFDPIALRVLKAPLTGANMALHQEMVDSLALFCGLGDLLYMNESGTINGYPVSNIAGGSLATAQSLTERLNYYRGCRLNGGLMSLMANVPTTLSKDDHEYDPNNACYDLAWLQAKFGGGATQGDLDALWAVADGAWRSWSLGNPPSQLVGPSCYSVRIGPLEIFYTDQIYGRSYHATVDGPTKYMLSPAQEEETLRQMGASTAPFKLINSTKQFISSSGFNDDGWCNIGGSGKGYETQLARILKDPRFPRQGALSVTGDEHLKSDMFVPENHFGTGSAGISQMSAGPATIPAIINIAKATDGLAYRTGVREKERDLAGGDVAGISVRGENNYVLLRVLPDRIERYRLGSRYGLKYFGYIGTADNLVRR
jgi:hypothetical protein